MTSDLNQQIQTFALHLIEREAKVRRRKNKRSASEHEKFLLSTGWLCKKLLAVHTAHMGASARISRDKNRYKAGRYVPEHYCHRRCNRDDCQLSLLTNNSIFLIDLVCSFCIALTSSTSRFSNSSIFWFRPLMVTIFSPSLPSSARK